MPLVENELDLRFIRIRVLNFHLFHLRLLFYTIFFSVYLFVCRRFLFYGHDDSFVRIEIVLLNELIEIPFGLTIRMTEIKISPYDTLTRVAIIWLLENTEIAVPRTSAPYVSLHSTITNDFGSFNVDIILVVRQITRLLT